MISKLATLQVWYIDLNKQKVKNPNHLGCRANGSKLISSVKFLLQDPISSICWLTMMDCRKVVLLKLVPQKLLKEKRFFITGNKLILLPGRVH